LLSSVHLYNDNTTSEIMFSKNGALETLTNFTLQILVSSILLHVCSFCVCLAYALLTLQGLKVPLDKLGI